jgi:hypothetical protein
MRGRVDVATGAASFVCRNSVYQMTQQRWSPEPTRIDIHTDHELRYWSERLGVRLLWAKVDIVGILLAPLLA